MGLQPSDKGRYYISAHTNESYLSKLWRGHKTKGRVLGERNWRQGEYILGEERSGGQGRLHRGKATQEETQGKEEASQAETGWECPRPTEVRNNATCLRDQGARVMSWTKQEENHSGRVWQSRQRQSLGALGPLESICFALQSSEKPRAVIPWRRESVWRWGHLSCRGAWQMQGDVPDTRGEKMMLETRVMEMPADEDKLKGEFHQ